MSAGQMMEEVIRFGVRSSHRFIVPGLRSGELQPLREFFQVFGALSECKTTSSQGVVYGFVAFFSQRVTQRVKETVKYAAIDGLRVRVTCVSRELRDRNRGLSTDKMIDLANFYFGFGGWSSEVLSCELCADSVREVEVVGDDHVDDIAAYDREVQRLAANARLPLAVGVKPSGVPSEPRTHNTQALFRAQVRVSWSAEHVISANETRNSIEGCGEKLAVCASLELALNLGEKSAVSEAIKNALLGLVLVVVYENADDDRAFEVGVHLLEDDAAQWTTTTPPTTTEQR